MAFPTQREKTLPCLNPLFQSSFVNLPHLKIDNIHCSNSNNFPPIFIFLLQLQVENYSNWTYKHLDAMSAALLSYVPSSREPGWVQMIALYGDCTSIYS